MKRGVKLMQEMQDAPLGGRGARTWAGKLRKSDAGREITVMGWVAVRRDLGGLTFLDLRDRTGILQIVLDPGTAAEAHAAAKDLRAEWVIRVDGVLAERVEGTVNRDLPTGEVELQARALEILNRSLTPPFELEEAEKANEELRLKYRYLDLRRPELFGNFVLRDRVVQAARQSLHDEGFLEVETPILMRSTPEGARDYLVPSRVHRGEWYALPQSPQILKQVLQVAGFEKYYQIARCFRDEDLRADRQPEFTQLDLEASFVEEEDVFGVIERTMVAMWRAAGEELPTPFPRLSYEEAMSRYGSDKPETRFGMEITPLEDLVSECGFQVFASTVASGGLVRGIGVPGAAEASRREITAWEDEARTQGAKGVVWIKKTEEGFSSPVLKHVGEETIAAIFAALGLGTGDIALVVAGDRDTVQKALGHLRLHVARERCLVPDEGFAPLWVYPFPLFEVDAKTGRVDAAHHPFCSPFPEDIDRLDTEPSVARGRTYDLVMNGYELGTGSVRIHRADVQEKVFAALGIGPEEARDRFGFLLDALAHGAPPHGGIALGMDRIVMILAGSTSLRDVVAFPKTTSAQDLMTGAPAGVDPEQLEELGLTSSAKHRKQE